MITIAPLTYAYLARKEEKKTLQRRICYLRICSLLPTLEIQRAQLEQLTGRLLSAPLAFMKSFIRLYAVNTNHTMSIVTVIIH